eukprot:scaffold2534_cov260-Pinguiococcus_pyrenoidosus.AAC.24
MEQFRGKLGCQSRASGAGILERNPERSGGQRSAKGIRSAHNAQLELVDNQAQQRRPDGVVHEDEGAPIHGEVAPKHVGRLHGFLLPASFPPSDAARILVCVQAEHKT